MRPGLHVIQISALLRRHGEECRSLLLHILTAAVRTLWTLFVVLGQGKGYFEGFMTIQADIIVDGHGKPPIHHVEKIVRPAKIEER